MSRSLPQSLSPDVMLDVFVKVEQGQELIRRQKSLGLKMDVLLKEAEDYIIQCHEIFAADPQGDVNGNRIPAVAELGNVYSRWKSYQEESRQRNVLAERIQESRKEGLRLQMSGKNAVAQSGSDCIIPIGRRRNLSSYGSTRSVVSLFARSAITKLPCSADGMKGATAA